jgi:diguanylate cyclase (GGDEF)-like protein/PAS domain S-box-containing protein
MKKKVKCWEIFACAEKECPSYELKELKCWLTSGTHCRDEIQGRYLEKMAMCLDCEVFKANMDVSSMKETIKVIDKQFKEFTAMVDERDKELEDTSMELSIGLSETLDALNKIASGDPHVRISEASQNELIAKLKQTVNRTAEGIGTIVDQSHEFAIGIAEHFDMLHKVSKGELDTRIPESSKDELLNALGKVTNQMIESVSREITERKQAEEAMRESEKKYRSVVENIPDIVWIADEEGRVIFIGRNVEEVYKFTVEEICEAVSNLWFGRIHPTDIEYVKEAYKMLFTRDKIFDVEYRIQRKDGDWIWLRNRAVTTHEKGGVRYADGVARDITERHKSTEKLQQVNEKLTTLVNELEQHTHDARLLGEMGGLLQTCLTVEEASTVIAQFAQQLFSRDFGALYAFSASRNVVEAVATWGESLSSESMFMPSDCWALRRGQVHLVEDTHTGLLCRHLSHPPSASYMCVPMMAHGEILGMLYLQSSMQGLSQPEGIVGRLAESKQRLAVTMAEQVALALANLKLQEALRIQSVCDPLTGMFNRRYMEESLAREVHRATRKKTQIGIIMIDLDHFKQFNDTFGHAAGDALLRELSYFLKKSFRGEDIACRYGGEEFVIILPETPLDITLKRAESLLEEIRHLNVQHLGRTLGTITTSLGVAVFPDHGTTGETVMRAADAALYQAKERGRDQVAVWQVKE